MLYSLHVDSKYIFYIVKNRLFQSFLFVFSDSDITKNLPFDVARSLFINLHAESSSSNKITSRRQVHSKHEGI